MAICSAVLGFRNVINGAAYISSEDSAYPFANAFDNKTNTEYSPAITSGTVTIEFTQSSVSPISYFALFSKNAGRIYRKPLKNIVQNIRPNTQ